MKLSNTMVSGLGRTIAKVMIEEMGYDNDCKFNPTDKEMERLEQGVRMMLVNGDLPGSGDMWEFIVDMVAGDEDERKATYGGLPGYEEMNKVLGEVFVK